MMSHPHAPENARSRLKAYLGVYIAERDGRAVFLAEPFVVLGQVALGREQEEGLAKLPRRALAPLLTHQPHHFAVVH